MIKARSHPAKVVLCTEWDISQCFRPAPGRTATSESATFRLAGVQPRLAANQAPARSATPATNETAARTR
jgi:hypothetical protein